MATLDDLREIAPPPAEPPPPVDWEDAAAQLGLRPPSDYMALVDEWGAGTFDDFIAIYVPGHTNPNLDLIREARGWAWALQEEAQAGEQHPFDHRIAPGGLLAWGVSGNGDPCFWHLREEDPAAWIVAVQEARSPDWHVYEGGLVDFLVAVLSGRERVSVFPDDVPSDAVTFLRG